MTTPDQLCFITKSSALSGVKYLNLSKCTMDETTVLKLLESPFLRNLEILRLANMENLAEKFILPNDTAFGLDHQLKILDIRHNQSFFDSSASSSHFLQHVMILGWNKRNYMNRSLTMSRTDKLYQKYCLNYRPPSEAVELSEWISLPRNPLHIFVPTLEQIKFVDTLLN